MVEELSRYSCDSCRSRKIKCSREASGCSTCKTDSRACAYSRSGVLRRSRRRRNKTPAALEEPRTPFTILSDVPASTGVEPCTANPPLDERLQRLGGDPLSSQPLRLLSSDHNSFWQEPEFVEMIERMKSIDSQFFTFEQEADWVHVVDNVLEQGQPMMMPIPADILSMSVLSPQLVPEKGYLLMFYGIMLTVATADSSFSDDIKLKLKWNLWLCLNDARLLLQPSEVNIQALILLACHVQDFHTPSLCWMVSTTAFRMFQALGRGVDAETRQRRSEMFWFLNTLDKSLALIFGRPPVFHRAMCKEHPMPSMQRLRTFQPHVRQLPRGATEPNSPPSLFGAHLLHQMHLASQITADIWFLLFDQQGSITSLEETRKRLRSWYEDTLKVLEASLLTERPFLDNESIRALELGIICVQFNYHYLTVLLIKSQRRLRDECLEASRSALLLLDGLVSGSVDVYNGVVWHLLYCPFTPFLVLFSHILADPGGNSSKRSLEAMERLPRFLKEMTSHHPLAARLYGVSNTILDRVRWISQRSVHESAHQNFNTPTILPEVRVEADDRTSDCGEEPSSKKDNFEYLTEFFPSFEPHQYSGRNISMPTGAVENAPPSYPHRTNTEPEFDEDAQIFTSAVKLSPQGIDYDSLAESMFDWFAWESYNNDQRQ